jgi:hypothetical protein
MIRGGTVLPASCRTLFGPLVAFGPGGVFAG